MKYRVLWLPLLALISSAGAQTLSPSSQTDALLKTLRKGGYVILMRHASSPREVPDKQTANPDNVNDERQLDAEGRSTAAAFGKALVDLKIPIGELYTSPTYRALETIRLAGLREPRPVPELGDNGKSMQGGTEAQAAWLRKKVTEFPKGANTLLITHVPNISGAFPQLGFTPADGEALVYGPDGKGGATIVARIKIEDWPKMAASTKTRS